jgi:hypothetical protein
MPKGMAAREAVLDGWEVYLYAHVCVERAHRKHAHKHGNFHMQSRVYMRRLIY